MFKTPYLIYFSSTRPGRSVLFFLGGVLGQLLLVLLLGMLLGKGLERGLDERADQQEDQSSPGHLQHGGATLGAVLPPEPLHLRLRAPAGEQGKEKKKRRKLKWGGGGPRRRTSMKVSIEPAYCDRSGTYEKASTFRRPVKEEKK